MKRNEVIAVLDAGYKALARIDETLPMNVYDTFSQYIFSEVCEIMSKIHQLKQVARHLENDGDPSDPIKDIPIQEVEE